MQIEFVAWYVPNSKFVIQTQPYVETVQDFRTYDYILAVRDQE